MVQAAHRLLLAQNSPTSSLTVTFSGLLRTDTLVRVLCDRQEPQLQFVLRMATALRDKPKPPKDGCAACVFSPSAAQVHSPARHAQALVWRVRDPGPCTP